MSSSRITRKAEEEYNKYDKSMLERAIYKSEEIPYDGYRYAGLKMSLLNEIITLGYGPSIFFYSFKIGRKNEEIPKDDIEIYKRKLLKDY